MAQISVIVPCYNVEKYVEKCVDSLLKQSFEDFEILLVDDGSKDTTLEICCRLETKDARIKVYHKENGGLSDARNYGIERAKADLITFIDSDDYVGKDFLKDLYTGLVDNQCDISMLPAQTLAENEAPKEIVSYHCEKLTAPSAMKKMMLRDGITHSSWGKLFKRELWDEIRFPVGQNYEDYATTYHVFGKAQNVMYLSKAQYYYIQHDNSIMHQKCSEKTLSVIKVSQKVTRYIIERFPECQIEALELQTAVCLKNMQSILNTDMNAFFEYQKKIIIIMKKSARKLLLSKKVPLKDKVKILALLFNKKIFIKLYNRFDGDIPSKK